LEVRVRPGLDQILKNTEFTWNISSIDTYSITLKLKFAKPLLLSQFGTHDLLEAEIRQRSLFRDTDGLTLAKNATYAEKAIPRQLGSEASARLTGFASQAVGVVAQIALASNLLLNWVLSFSLNHLWGMVNSLQIVIHFPLTSVYYPANASLFFSYFNVVATFDVLPTDSINDYVLTFTETPAIGENFEELDYGGTNFISNLGSIYYFFPLMVLCLLLLALLKLLGLLGVKCAEK